MVRSNSPIQLRSSSSTALAANDARYEFLGSVNPIQIEIILPRTPLVDAG